MKKDIPAKIMDVASMAAERTAAADMVKIIPAAAAAPVLYWREKMQAKHAEYMTEVHLMTAPSLILPMTGANLWNLYAVPA